MIIVFLFNSSSIFRQPHLLLDIAAILFFLLQRDNSLPYTPLSILLPSVLADGHLLGLSTTYQCIQLLSPDTNRNTSLMILQFDFTKLSEENPLSNNDLLKVIALLVNSIFVFICHHSKYALTLTILSLFCLFYRRLRAFARDL